MNQLNSLDLKEAVIGAFQEILAEDPNFFFTDRLSILTWKSKKVKDALVTKVGNVRYLGMLKKDSQGQDYWKYKPLTSEKLGGESSAIQPSSSTNPSLPVKNETPVQSVEESEQVKKFREKFPNEFSAKQKYENPNESKTDNSVKQ